MRQKRQRGTPPLYAQATCRVCERCKAIFMGRKNALYCSDSCYKQAKRKREHASRPTVSQAAKDFIYEDKILKGCQRCCEKRPRCLDYHHVDPAVKKANVSVLKTLKAVKEEIAKCVLLCANCHRVEEFGDGYRLGSGPTAPTPRPLFLP